MSIEFKANYSLQGLSTFQMPAKALHYVYVDSHASLQAVLQSKVWAQSQQRVILGGGSNSIFLDDVTGCLLHMGLTGKTLDIIDANTVEVIVGAGEQWDLLVQWCLEQQAFGLENLSWIPGSVGAAPIQNIGAYGVELNQVLHSVEVVDLQDDVTKFTWILAADCGLSYRDSFFKSQWRDRFIISRIRLRLARQFIPQCNYQGLEAETFQTRPSARTLRERVIALRQAKLPEPAQLANCGSFFTNPIIPVAQFEHLQRNLPKLTGFKMQTEQGVMIKLSAAFLLDQLGLAGFRQDCFGCYAQQPLVVVHYTDDTSSLVLKRRQFLRFVDLLQQQVNTAFGIWLTPEPNLITSYKVLLK